MELLEWRDAWLNNLFIWEKSLPSLIVLLIELTFLSLLFYARYNARRLNIKRKLMILYTIVPLNTMIWFFYMGLKGLRLLTRIQDTSENTLTYNILRNYQTILHGMFGALTMLLATFLLVYFLVVFLLNNRSQEKLTSIRPSNYLLLILFLAWVLVVAFNLVFITDFGVEGGIVMLIVVLIFVLLMNYYISTGNTIISLPTIRQMKPLMITTVICWSITVVLGSMIFIHTKIIEIFPSLV